MWGSSFLFMKIAVPSMGPAAMIEARVGIGALVLTLVGWLTRQRLPRGREWIPCFYVGVFYTAIPLLMWGYASRNANASLLSIINATAPLFGAVVARVWHGQRLSARGNLGLALGFAGVAVLVSGEGLIGQAELTWAVAAAFTGALLYGVMANYPEFASATMPPYTNVLGSLWIATLLIAPLLWWFPVQQTPPLAAWGAVLMLGVMSTALAYILFVHLVENVGAASALSVSYLIPVFGTLWGVLFLGERVGVQTIIGAAMIIGGIALVARAHRAAQAGARV